MTAIISRKSESLNKSILALEARVELLHSRYSHNPKGEVHLEIASILRETVEALTIIRDFMRQSETMQLVQMGLGVAK